MAVCWISCLLCHSTLWGHRHKSLLFYLDALSIHVTLFLVQPYYISITLAIQWLAGFADRDKTQVQFPSRVLCLTNNTRQGRQLSRILDNIQHGSWTSQDKYTVQEWQTAHIPGRIAFCVWCFDSVSVHLVLLCLTSSQCLSFKWRRLTVLFKPGQDVCD